VAFIVSGDVGARLARIALAANYLQETSSSPAISLHAFASGGFYPLGIKFGKEGLFGITFGTE